MANDDAPNRKKRETDQRGARAGQTTMPQEHGGSIGQAAYEPTERDRDYVRKHVFFLGAERTALRLGISTRTLQRHFAVEIAEANEELLEAGGKTAMQRALAGDGPMLRFVLATRFPDLWSPKYRLQHEGKIGVERTLDLRDFLKDKSEDETAAILAAIDALAAAGGVDIARSADGSEATGREPPPSSEA